MEYPEEEKKLFYEWLKTRPESVQKVAERIVPWKKYINTKEPRELENYYILYSYGVQPDGTVTITCEKHNDKHPFGGYNVFGMNPDDLIEEII